MLPTDKHRRIVCMLDARRCSHTEGIETKKLGSLSCGSLPGLKVLCVGVQLRGWAEAGAAEGGGDAGRLRRKALRNGIRHRLGR